MKTFAADGSVQPHSQPRSELANPDDWPGKLRSSVWALRNEALRSPLISTGRTGIGRGHQALRSPGELHLHSAFNELNLAGWLINTESQGKPQNVHEPILITHAGILLAGFAEWHAAVCAGQAEIDCVEFALNDDEALQLILTLHRPRTAWNDFTRTELALEQEPYFQSKLLPTRSPAASTRVWQICRKLSTLTCGKKLPILSESVLGLLAT